MWQGAPLPIVVIALESGMIMQQEQVTNKIAGGQTRKRWTAPEVTRLNFPKTAANGHGHSFEVTSVYDISLS
jgi:hypothetical protein